MIIFLLDGDVLPLQNYTPTRDGYVFIKWLVNWDDVALQMVI